VIFSQSFNITFPFYSYLKLFLDNPVEKHRDAKPKITPELYHSYYSDSTGFAVAALIALKALLNPLLHKESFGQKRIF
jgi:hypothetical protein